MQDVVMIGDVKYVPENSIQPKIVKLGETTSIAQEMIGQFVIVRTRNEGINAGTIVNADETGVKLANCRRIYYHKPLDKNLSWYEGVAVSGLSAQSKISGTVLSKTMIEDYSLTECSKEAEKSIMEFTPNAQS